MSKSIAIPNPGIWVLTRHAETNKVIGGGVNVAMSWVAAATARPMDSAMAGLFRIPSGENSEGSIGRSREGNSFPTRLQV